MPLKVLICEHFGLVLTAAGYSLSLDLFTPPRHQRCAAVAGSAVACETLLPAQAQVVILADREFGTVERLRYVAQQGWHYAIRLKSNVEFYDPSWEQPFRWVTLTQMAPQPGGRYALTDLCLTKTGFYRVHVACAWAVGSDEPWFIATNLPQPLVALKEYARRFGCEELFSDLKKRGLQWADSQIREPARLNRLLLVLALLVVWLLWLGRQVRLQQLDLELVSPAHRRRLSLFQTALRWLKRRFAQNNLPLALFSTLLGQVT